MFRVYPARGPMSGGTELNLSGKFLNIGSSVSVYLDHLPCHVNKSSITDHHLTCVTSQANQPYQVSGMHLSIAESVIILTAKTVVMLAARSI